MKRLSELANEAPVELRELICGLDDESVGEAQLLPTNTAGLVDYHARGNRDPLDFNLGDLLKVEPNSEIRFSDLPIEIQLPMGLTENGEFVETHSLLNQAKESLSARFARQLQRLASQETGHKARGVFKRLASVLEGHMSDLPVELAVATGEFQQSLSAVETEMRN